MKIAIIGTAGRREDGPRMTKELYAKMYYRACHLIEQLKQDNPDECLHLVSGGAAWSDHIAVSLFLGQAAETLTLHLPAPLNTDKHEYIENPKNKWCPGRTSNYYHRIFSKKMGRSTIAGICDAIEKGAVAHIYGGFRERNKVVGQVDVVIAFTWGEGTKPKDGGTAHTWGKSTAPKKIHIPLRSL